MKFGVMMHKHTQNIGDDIQTYAAARLLPQVDYFLDRESLDTFQTEDGAPAAIVMSAWYMWHKWNWPPSKYIVPLFVGMHYKDYRNSDASWEERVQNVTDLLTIYQNAKCVITRRLHCALPCLAMGVPVLLLNDEKAGADIRFIPYYDWIYNCSKQEFISKSYDYDILNPPSNKNLHLPYRQKLLETISGFVKQYENLEGTPDELSRISYTPDDLIKWRHDTMKKCMDNWLYITREHIHTITKQTKQLNELSVLYENTETELEELKKAYTLSTQNLKEMKQNLKKKEKEFKKKEQELKEKESLNQELKKLLSRKCVKYGVSLHNILTSKKKHISLDKYR